MTLALALGPQPLMPMYLLLLAEEYTWLIQAMQGLIGVGVSLALGASLRFAARAGLEVLDFVPQTSLLLDPCAYYRGPFCARHSRPEPWTITAARTLAATTAAIHPRPTHLSPADDDDPWRYAELACLWLLTAVSLPVGERPPECTPSTTSEGADTNTSASTTTEETKTSASATTSASEEKHDRRLF